MTAYSLSLGGKSGDVINVLSDLDKGGMASRLRY